MYTSKELETLSEILYSDQLLNDTVPFGFPVPLIQTTVVFY